MTKTRKPFAERIRIGLEEALAHARGEITLKTIEHPDLPPEIDAKTLVALREEASMSQSIFAKVLNVSTKTVQSWEQGVRVPSKSTRRLIQLFAVQPEMVCQTVGVKPVHLRDFEIEVDAKGHRRIVKVVASRKRQMETV